ncbi:MAG: prepilin-type N-terminal cleavage/methylation domain-containing protein [Lactobacillales bacterium]|nr:prepilin-type N-terminal cleavage/methylation domain-containing protein [Lactobacillales bacterium]
MRHKNKKGFTLIELLAVIIIIGIIALIAVPKMANVIKDSKKKTFESSANGLVESAKIYYSSKTDDVDFEGKVFKFGKNGDISGLKFKGEKPTDGELVVNSSGEIKMYITDGEYCAFKDFKSNVITITEGKECVLKSETPIISLAVNKVTTNRISLVAECSYESGKEINIDKYEFSKDGGKTWNSTSDKNYYTYSNLEQKEYTFAARCITTAGTSASKQIVTSTTKIDEVIINVPEGWAREKEITISYPKGRYEYQYQELDNDSTISEDKWVTVEETENGSTHNVFKKTYTENKYIIARVLDNTGNYVDSASTAIQKIDRTPPVCGNWTGNSEWTNKNVTVKVSCNETQDETNNISGCSSSSYDVKTYSTTTKTEALSYTIKDNAGNETTCSDTVDVYVDKTAPSIPTIVNSSSGNWTKDDVTITASSTDTHSGIDQIYYGYADSPTLTNWGTDYVEITNGKKISGTWTYATNTTVYIRACDVAGNCSASTTTPLKIDHTAPDAITISSVDNNATSIKINYTGGADSQSGILKYVCHYGTSTSLGSTKDLSSTATSCTITTNTGTKYYYKICAINNAGLETCSSVGNVTTWIGIPSDTYTTGDEITYGGKTWLVVKDNGSTTTLISKSNIATGAYTSATTSIDSYISGNTTFALDKSLLALTGAGLPTRTAMPANSSGTPFWTKTTGGDGYYILNSNGATTYTKYSRSSTSKYTSTVTDGNVTTGTTTTIYNGLSSSTAALSAESSATNITLTNGGYSNSPIYASTDRTSASYTASSNISTYTKYITAITALQPTDAYSGQIYGYAVDIFTATPGTARTSSSTKTVSYCNKTSGVASGTVKINSTMASNTSITGNECATCKLNCMDVATIRYGCSGSGCQSYCDTTAEVKNQLLWYYNQEVGSTQTVTLTASSSKWKAGTVNVADSASCTKYNNYTLSSPTKNIGIRTVITVKER